MATTIQRAFEVSSVNDRFGRAFVVFDYATREATAMVEYDGRAYYQTRHAKEGIEYAAIERAALAVCRAARLDTTQLLELLAEEVSAKVDAYLYA